MAEAPWLDQAWLEFGTHEIVGNADHPRIMALFRDAGHPEIVHDETAWCAAFVGACLERVGVRSTRSLLARSYVEWGQPATEASVGNIAILSRGNNPALGHVGFVVGATDQSIFLLGGNQGDGVNVAQFERSALVGLRRPATAEAALFETALAHILEMEGGYDDDPADPGGPTNQGITLADFARWRQVPLSANTRPGLVDELGRISGEDVRSIYRQFYWLPCCAPALPPGLDLMHFDAAVNHGLSTATRFLQQAVGAAVDGECGPQTLKCAAERPITATLTAYADIRRARYRSLAGFARFGRGWLARVDRTLKRSIDRFNFSEHATLEKDTRSMTAADTPSLTDAPAPLSDATPAGVPDGKWWGQSLTMWGTLITALATVLPVLAPLFGFEISSETVRQLGGQAAQTFQALAGLAGTIMAVYGRSRASQPLTRKLVTLKL